MPEADGAAAAAKKPGVEQCNHARAHRQRARGELDGIGLWTLTPAGAGTHVRYDWDIDITKPWQVRLAPLLRPVFAWNHNVVMRWGYEDLKTRLIKTAN